MPNFKIPACAEASADRQISNQPQSSKSKTFLNLNLGFDLAFELDSPSVHHFV